MALHALQVSKLSPARHPRPTVEVAERDLQRLIALRCLLRKSRTARRIDGFKVCAAVGCGIAPTQESVSTSLMQVLTDAWGRAPVIFQPNAKHASFDEAWLLSLLSAGPSNQQDSVAFLLGSRLPKHQHRMVMSLLRAITI